MGCRHRSTLGMARRKAARNAPAISTEYATVRWLLSIQAIV